MNGRLVTMGAHARAIVLGNLVVGVVYWTAADAHMRDGEPIVVDAGLVSVDAMHPDEHVFLFESEQPTEDEWKLAAELALDLWFEEEGEE